MDDSGLMEGSWAMRQYEWMVEGVLLAGVGVLGILGNISAIGIFWLRFSKQSGTQHSKFC